MADKNTVYMSEKQKVKEITDKLEAGLKELFESEKYKSYLSTMSKFHNYSFNNTLLIAMQKPEATLVAGYQAWQKNFERHVNKGEKAIRILAPAPYKIKEERDKLDPVTGEMMFDENGMPQKEETEVTIPAFRAVSVFDVSQTDGKPIPELEVNELLSTVEGYEDFVQALMNISPVPIAFEDIPGDSKGYFSTAEKRIAVQENMSESQTLKTMVHEVVGEAEDGLDAIAVCRQKKPDFVIMDINMPVMTGLEATKVINEDKLAGFVIILTAYRDKEIADQAVNTDVMGYIVKPVDEDTLIPAVKIAIHNYKQREAMAKEFHKTQEALDDRKYLDRAKGLVMERKNMSEKEAFTYIRSLSMDKGISMTELSKMLLKAYEG